MTLNFDYEKFARMNKDCKCLSSFLHLGWKIKIDFTFACFFMTSRGANWKFSMNWDGHFYGLRVLIIKNVSFVSFEGTDGEF